MKAAPKTCVTLALTLAAAMLAGTPAVAPDASAETAEAAKAKRLVLSPEAGRVLRGNTVRIRVRVPRRAELRARLNGVRVGGDFRRTSRGVHTLRASISHGLRRGRNRLRVAVSRPGRRGRRSIVRFRVRRSKSLVGAGRDRIVVGGSRWRLSGRVLKAKGDRRGMAPRWRVIRAPRRSKARVSTAKARVSTAGASAARAALLTAPARLSPTFRPDVPGLYKLRLTVGRGDLATSEVLRLDAVPQSLLVGLDTMSGGPANPGIRVGDTNYPLSQAGGSGYLQLLVLTRNHLAHVSNTRFNSADALGSVLGSMAHDKLAIVSLQSYAAGTPSDSVSGDLDKALAQIGWPTLGSLANTPGTLSAIGVPGMKRGDADVKRAQDWGKGDPRPGRITGYLSPDQNRSFGFVPSRLVPFTYTLTTPRPPDTPRECGATCAGFLVRYQDQHTLEVENVQYYATGDPSRSRQGQTNEAARLTNDLQDQEPGQVITIRTVSTPTPGATTYLPPLAAIDRSTLTGLANQVVKLGGTRHGFNSVARASGPQASRGAVYTLVGWAGAAEGEGAEAAAGLDGAGAAPVISGVLRPNRQLQFRPESVKQNDNVTNRLSTVTLQPPTTSWPLDDDPGAKAALSWLASQDGRLGANPRTSYWLQDFSVIGTWLDIAGTIRAVSYVPGRGFNEADFDAAKEQLLKELNWVFKVRSYVDQLSTVFKESGQAAWAETHVIADNVHDAVKPPNDHVSVAWFEFAEILLDLAGPLTGDATSAVADVLELSVWAYGAMEDGSPTGDEFPVAADQLGARLEQEAVNTRKAISRMGDVVVSDYAKLSLVGTNALCAPGPGCPEGWSFTGDDSTQASADIDRGIQRLAYEKFVPMAYYVFQLGRKGQPPGFPPPIKRSGPPRDIEGYLCAHSRPEWPDAPRLAYTSLFQNVDPNGVDDWYDTFILHTSVSVFSPNTYPPDRMLDHMFKPVPDTSDPTDDGLGMSLNDMVRNAKYSWYHGSLAKEDYYCRWVY